MALGARRRLVHARHQVHEEAGRKLVVDCAAKGVMFAEADADLTADDFGDVKCPAFPCFEQFILESTNIAGVEPVVDHPLQRICHCVVDAPGAMQFEKAICEFTRRATEALPSVTPSWGREMFMARQPPRPSYPHLDGAHGAAAVRAVQDTGDPSAAGPHATPTSHTTGLPTPCPMTHGSRAVHGPRVIRAPAWMGVACEGLPGDPASWPRGQ
ncbi:benzyl alcohol O-benzoyltransferase-like [Miscanthus floridulus]|uniref:benzyl alcohol O-benzoyltransferase-like n=1 Tax=Miscanthus floridulus TaxID=154761 RepID=UPI00345A3186